MAIYVLLAAVICLMSAAVVWEFAVSMESWEQWEDPKRSGNEDWYSLENLTPGVRIAKYVFWATVLPPAWLFESRSYRTGYGFLALETSPWGRGGSFHHNPPPLMQAVEFWKYGYPFWFAVAAGFGELGCWLRRRVRGA